MTITRLADLADPAACPRLVIKVGSSLLVDKDGAPRRTWLVPLVAEIAAAQQRGQQVIIVSSGAIALGSRRLGMSHGGRASLADAQAAAAVGQIALAGLWAELFSHHGMIAAQLLLTLEDLEDRRRYLNVTATITRLLDAAAVPVINENDSVATHEIRFGDNDRLAARVAQAAQANGVLLLSDVAGLYDRNPSEAGASRLPLVQEITAEIHAMATGESASGMGSGGMKSKIQAAEIAVLAGISLAIIDGRPQAPLAHAIASDSGTVFLPQRKEGARKAWLGGSMRLKGTLTIDAGAAKALAGGNSLLAAGIVGVEGTFQRGDVVAIRDADGTVLAHGLSEYDSTECARLMGSHTRTHEELLGYAPRSAVVHRDQLVML